MTKIRRAYRAIARAYRLHLPIPKWAIELLKGKAQTKEEE